jgi:hypothetical protein
MNKQWIWLVALIAVAGPMISDAGAQFALRGSVFGNGGTQSAGGGLVLRGTAGQAAVGISDIGSHILLYGFWCYGGSRVVSVNDPAKLGPSLPQSLSFGSPFPNPAQGRVNFELALPKSAKVKLSVYDARGRAVGASYTETLEAGWHKLQWGGHGHGHIRSGVYFARLLVDGQLKGERRIVIVQ